MRLDDHRVAGGKRSCCLPAQQHQWIVEGKYDDDRTERFLDAEVELPGNRRAGNASRLMTRKFGIIIDGRRAPGHFVDGFLVRLPLLARQALRIWSLVLSQERCNVVKNNGTAARIHAHPRASRGIGAFDRVVHLAVGRVGDTAGVLFRRGIDHVEVLRRAAGLETAVNVDFP